MFARSYFPKPVFPPTYYPDGPLAYRGTAFAPSYFAPSVFGRLVTMGPVPAVFIVTNAAGATIGIIPGDSFQFDLSGLLPDGRHTIGIHRRDMFGRSSARETIDIEVIGGTAKAELYRASRVKAIALAAGMVAVEWQHTNSAKQAIPRKWEIVDIANAGAILATIEDNPGDSRMRVELGPYADGQSITFAVRSSDGLPGGQRGDFVVAPPVSAKDGTPGLPVSI